MKLMIVYHAGQMAPAHEIYRALMKAGPVELTVVVPTETPVAPAYDPSGWLRAVRQRTAEEYEVVPVPLREPGLYYHGFHDEPLRKVIRDVKPDVIQVMDEMTSGYLRQVVWHAFRGSRRSRIFFYAFQNIPFEITRRERWKWALAWNWMSGGMGASREALAVAREAGFPSRKPLERVFWGVSMEVFRPMNSPALKERLRLAKKQVVGFAGRLAPEKGLNVLLDAMRKLPPNVHALIIGDGPLRPELQRLRDSAEWAGRLHLCPSMQQELLAQHVNCMDALAVPSLTTPRWKEQYGRVIAEAMACGVPVIGSDSGAIPEVIGPAGVVVREGDSAAWAEAIGRLLASDSERARLREEGLRRAQQELSAGAMAAAMLAFYKLTYS